MRLEKLLDLPNSFEIKRALPTEKERVERLRREAIEAYYMKNAATPSLMVESEASFKKRDTLKRRGTLESAVKSLEVPEESETSEADEVSKSADSDTKH